MVPSKGIPFPASEQCGGAARLESCGRLGAGAGSRMLGPRVRGPTAKASRGKAEQTRTRPTAKAGRACSTRAVESLSQALSQRKRCRIAGTDLEQGIQACQSVVLFTQRQVGPDGIQVGLDKFRFQLLRSGQQRQGLSESAGLDEHATEVGEGLGIVAAKLQGSLQRRFSSREVTLLSMHQAKL